MTKRQGQTGFTLVELMAVVAIIGVLATVGMVSYSRYQLAAQGGEAVAMIQNIRIAQEAHKTETLLYKSCGTDLSKTFPMEKPNDKKWGWGGDANGLGSCWKQLNVQTDGAVRFGYAVVAGGPGKVAPAGIKTKKPVSFNDAKGPWYVIQALGDRDNDGDYAVWLGSSFSGEVYSENDTE